MTWVASAIVGGSVITGYMGSQAAGKQSEAAEEAARMSTAEQRRQFDLQRGDTAPYREAGENALSQIQAGLRGGDYDPAQFQYGGQVPEGAPLPEFGARNRFAFDLEGDQGYQFAKGEAIKETNRAAAQGGRFGSGNRLAEIADRVTGVASQYADQAFNRQMAGSRENYGRDVSEYGLDYGRATDIYGRDLSREATDYSRGLTQYGLEADREQNVYGQQQNYLNRLSSLAGQGQTAVGQSGAAGSNMANAVANINAANARQQGGAAATRYGAANQAIQGGISNYLLSNQLQQPGAVPAGGNYYGGGRVAPGGSFPNTGPANTYVPR